MKKVIVLVAVLALATTGVFAQEAETPKFTIGGWIGTGASLIGGNTDNSGLSGLTTGKNVAGESYLIGRLNATGETADGKFGGYIRVGAKNMAPDLRTRAWWKPNDIFKVTIGAVDEGAVNNIAGWGWYANDMEDFMVGWSNPSAGGGGAWYGMARGGWWVGPDNENGVGLSITPVTGLALNLFTPVLNFDYYDGASANKIWGHSKAQFLYAIEGVGNISVAYQAGVNTITNDGGKLTADAHQVFASFYTSLLDDKLGLNVGAKYTIPVWDDDNVVYTPASVGLAAQYVFGDAFTLKLRLASTFAGSQKVGGASSYIDDPFNIGFDINPVISVAGVKIFLEGGIVITGDGNELTWHVNPIVQKEIGPGSFFAGVNFKDNGKANSMAWSIPVGIIVSF